MSNSGFSRRDLLIGAGAGLLAAGCTSANVAQAQANAPVPAPIKKGLRVAFMTDSHVPKKGQLSNLRPLSRFPQALKMMADRKPDLVVWGGDNVFAVDYGDNLAQATEQFDNWESLIAESYNGPKLSVIGNHDIWKGDAANANTELGGKGMAIKRFGMESRYMADEAGGWRFLLLDCFHDSGCRIDDEQLEWLKSQLSQDKRPTVLVSHAPLFSATGIYEKKPQGNNYTFGIGDIIGNVHDVVDTLRQHDHGKLALSGHMHHRERLDYFNTTFINGGAVSGAWWAGNYKNHPAAFVMLELFPDGTWTHEFVMWDAARNT